ncbi:transposase [Plakobranchus ocellatus]|uniref:Transposase n=1 Tax=Plakobranchus ocellatus TaxID=259542 RepID=A0AAV3YEI0_9GAST|nr:transposase [Plakobranchus ocellatus]
MATSNDLLIKQRSVIEFLAAEGCSAENIHAKMKTVYGEMCIPDCVVHKWVRIFKGEDPERQFCVIASVRVGPFPHRTRLIERKLSA